MDELIDMALDMYKNDKAKATVVLGYLNLIESTRKQLNLLYANLSDFVMKIDKETH